MKAKIFVLSLIMGFTGYTTQGQLLEKLKQRAKEKGMETQAVSYDSTAYNKDNDHSDEQGSRFETAGDFFTNDVEMDLYNKDGHLVQTSFFDADVIAMRTQSEVSPKPIYHDSKGYVYAYSDDDGQYAKISLLPGSSMGFMTAGMTTQVYELPQEPYFEAFQAMSEKDVALNFLVLELAFIYKPQHFKNDALYIEEEISCKGASQCIRFKYTDPEYEGSYIQFDGAGRLTEFYIKSTSPQFADSKNPSGRFVYKYEECSVELPDAVEQSMIPGPLGKMLHLERGLEPWKYNKKDNK